MKINTEDESDPPEIRLRMTELLREAGAARRLASACSLTRATRALSWSGHCARHPDWDATQLRIEFVRMLYGNRLAEGFAEALARLAYPGSTASCWYK